MARKPPILAVDDTPGNLITLGAVLGDDFDLRFAHSGASALAKLEQAPDVDVILLDLQMPSMDGFETAKRIKKLQGCKDIPIVFISAVFKEDPCVKRGFDVGGIDFLTKPFDPDLLRLKLGAYASYRHKTAVLDVREQQRRETEHLRGAGRMLTEIIESLPVGVLICDIDGRICQVTDEVSRILKAGGVIHNHECGTVLGWWDSNAVLLEREGRALARALRAGESSRGELHQIRCLDGSAKTIRVCVSPLRGDGSGIVGAVIVINDVTEPKRIGDEIETQIAQVASTGPDGHGVH